MSAIEFSWKFDVQCRNCTFSIERCSTLDSAQSEAARHINTDTGSLAKSEYPNYNHICEISQIMLAGRDV